MYYPRDVHLRRDASWVQVTVVWLVFSKVFAVRHLYSSITAINPGMDNSASLTPQAGIDAEPGASGP